MVRRFGPGRVDLSRLRALDVLKFVRRTAGQLKNKRVLLMTTALRSFLRFARYRGDIKLDLAACVPPVASWSLSNLPKSLPPAQVEQVLANVRQRSTAVGQRDHAILLLLARLGLRGGEVGNLVLEDIDWENSRQSGLAHQSRYRPFFGGGRPGGDPALAHFEVRIIGGQDGEVVPGRIASPRAVSNGLSSLQVLRPGLLGRRPVALGEGALDRGQVGAFQVEQREERRRV